MSCNPQPPSRAGFVLFLRQRVGIPAAALPDDSVYIDESYCAAIAFVNNGMWACAGAGIFTQTVYNMGASLLLNNAGDVGGSSYFADLRKKLGLDTFSPGLLTSAADQGTSGTRMVPNALQNLTLADLQLLKDPYGQRVAAVLMEMGSIWGIS